MVRHFNNFLASIMSFALFFLLLHPALERCSCLLCTYSLLGAARKNHSLTGWCHYIFMVSNLSWALTAGPHPLCSWSLLPPILRLAVSELFHTSPDTHSIPFTSLSPAVLTAWNRSHCIGSPPFPSTISSSLSLSHLSLPLCSCHTGAGHSCSQTNLTTCAQLFLRNILSICYSLPWVLSLQPFSLLVLLYQCKNMLRFFPFILKNKLSTCPLLPVGSTISSPFISQTP